MYDGISENILKNKVKRRKPHLSDETWDEIKT
jgi:hypothetical protein